MFGAILCLILILAGMFGWMKFGGLFTGAKYSSDKNMYLVSKYISMGILVLGLVAGVFQFLIIVSPGDAVTTEVLGTVDSTILYAGVNIINPICTPRTFNIKTQEITKVLKMPAKDQMEITVDATVQYRLNPANLAVMREKIGPNEENFMNVIFNPAMRGAFRDAAANYDSAELYITKREEFQLNVVENLRAQVDSMYIIEDVIIRNVTPPAKIVAAIADKQQAQQEAQKMEFVLEKSKLEAEQKVIEAKGIADAQDIIANKLTPAYLAWYKIDMLRQLAGSENSTFFFIPDDIKTLPMMLNK